LQNLVTLIIDISLRMPDNIWLLLTTVDKNIMMGKQGNTSSLILH
jgi:hypothetical protein